MENTEIMELQALSDSILDGMNDSAGSMYVSFQVDDVESRMKLYEAVSESGLTIKECVNKRIAMVDVVVIPVEVVNEDKTKTVVPRTVIIDASGKYYTASSWGLFRSIQKIKAIFGSLHFDPPMNVIPVEIKTKNGFTLNLKLAR